MKKKYSSPQIQFVHFDTEYLMDNILPLSGGKSVDSEDEIYTSKYTDENTWAEEV